VDERTENALQQIVIIVGRASATGCTMLSGDDERAIAEVLEKHHGTTLEAAAGVICASRRDRDPLASRTIDGRQLWYHRHAGYLLTCRAGQIHDLGCVGDGVVALEASDGCPPASPSPIPRPSQPPAQPSPSTSSARSASSSSSCWSGRLTPLAYAVLHVVAAWLGVSLMAVLKSAANRAAANSTTRSANDAGQIS